MAARVAQGVRHKRSRLERRKGAGAGGEEEQKGRRSRRGGGAGGEEEQEKNRGVRAQAGQTAYAALEVGECGARLLRTHRRLLVCVGRAEHDAPVDRGVGAAKAVVIVGNHLSRGRGGFVGGSRNRAGDWLQA